MKKMFLFAGAAVMLLAACSKTDNTQTEPEFGLSPVINNVGPDKGEVSLTITGNDTWTVNLTEWSTENTDWCTTEVTEGEGAFTLKLTVEQAVSTTDSRSVIVEVSNGTKALQSKIIQAPLELGEGEVLIVGLDGVGRIWSAYNLSGKGTFETDMEATSAVFQFNRDKAWPFDPSKNGGAFGGGSPASDGMVPVEGFMDACKAYSEPHRKFAEDGITAVDDDEAWDEANDPCPEGWRVPTTWEIIQTLGFCEPASYTLENATNFSFNCIRVNAGERGFTKDGLLVGWGTNVPDRITKSNVIEEGGMFIPQSGWISSAGGYTDRDWMFTLWGATSHNDAIAGMYLTTYNDYCDHWGWGDGHKDYATVVRCIKK